MRRKPLHPAFVFFRKPFEKRDHPRGINLRPLQQQQSRQIGISLLLSTELYDGWRCGGLPVQSRPRTETRTVIIDVTGDGSYGSWALSLLC